jgi:hypothetical protein
MIVVPWTAMEYGEAQEKEALGCSTARRNARGRCDDRCLDAVRRHGNIMRDWGNRRPLVAQRLSRECATASPVRAAGI